MKQALLRGLMVVVAGLGMAAVLAPEASLAAPRPGCTDEFSIDNGINCAAPTGTDRGRKLEGSAGIFVGIINTIIFIVGALSILLIVIGGLRYVVSGGDAKGVEDAKNTILYSVIGLVVAIGAYAIVNAVINKFGGSTTTTTPTNTTVPSSNTAGPQP